MATVLFIGDIMNVNEGLLPCPFCGGTPKLHTDGITAIICAGCGMIVNNQHRSAIKLKGQWNCRAHFWHSPLPKITDYQE